MPGVLRFGKYRGLSHLEVAFSYPEYAVWLSGWPHLRDYDKRELEKAFSICRTTESSAVRQMIESARQQRRSTVELDELPEFPEIAATA